MKTVKKHLKLKESIKLIQKTKNIMETKNKGYQTFLQTEIIHAINSINFPLIYDLGVTRLDLNFKQIRENEFPIYPLFSAAAKGNLELMKMILLNKTIDLQVKDKSGINAFWIACLFGHGFIMKELANHQIDVLITNHRGINALHLACTQNYPSIVRMLIYSGFPLHNECNHGMTAIQIAAFYGFKDIVNIMIKYAKTLPNPK